MLYLKKLSCLRFALLGCLLFFTSTVHAELYKYLDKNGGTLLTEKRMGKGYQLLKVYKIKRSEAYRSSVKSKASGKKVKKNWKGRKTKRSKKHRHKKNYKNLVKANGRDTGILKGCSNRRHLSRQAQTYSKTIQIYSRIYGVDEELIHAIVRQESCFNEGAHSRVGAIGLMQLMPLTALDLSIHDPWNPELNIQGGIKYIAQMLDMFDGNHKLAIAAYNAGPGNVNKYKGIPPFRETRNYVKKVYAEYKRLKSTGIPNRSITATDSSSDKIELASIN